MFTNGSFRDHRLGDFLQRDHRLGLVLIPKNATCTFKKVSEWKRSNFYLHSRPERFIVILRDPGDRLLSAINMNYTTHVNNIATLGTYALFNEKSVRTDDSHYAPQSTFVDGIDLTQIDFFWFNTNVVQDISDYYGLGFSDIPVENQSKRLITGLDHQWVEKIYRRDFALINTVKFINRRNNVIFSI